MLSHWRLASEGLSGDDITSKNKALNFNGNQDLNERCGQRHLDRDANAAKTNPTGWSEVGVAWQRAVVACLCGCFLVRLRNRERF